MAGVGTARNGSWVWWDTVSNRTIAKANNTPGGGPYDYMDDFGDDILFRARRYTLLRVGQDGTPGVNHPMNATHRGAQVGLYMASWDQRRFGNQSKLQREIINYAGHADVVEFGRKRSTRWQRFGWLFATRPFSENGKRVERPSPGRVKTYPRTARRGGRYILRDAARYEARKRGVPFG